jgi:hypothetical protein
MTARTLIWQETTGALDFGEQLTDSRVAGDRDDAQLLPEFILKSYSRVVLTDPHVANIWRLQSFGHGQV